MSFEILENPGQTVYAPLNTTIDADRDYGLADMEACGCNGGAARTQMQLGGTPQLGGYYQNHQLAPGMLGGTEKSGSGMLWVFGGVLGLWALWAWVTPLGVSPERY